MTYRELPTAGAGDQAWLDWWAALPGPMRLEELAELAGGRRPELRRALLSRPKASGLTAVSLRMLRDEVEAEPVKRRL